MARKALCIGINNYPGHRHGPQGCVNDAEDWSAELTARGYVVQKLTDAQATKAALVSAIRGLVGARPPATAGVITYSARHLRTGRERR